MRTLGQPTHKSGYKIIAAAFCALGQVLGILLAASSVGGSNNSFLEASNQLNGLHDQSGNLLVDLRGAPALT